MVEAIDRKFNARHQSEQMKCGADTNYNLNIQNKLHSSLMNYTNSVEATFIRSL